MGVLQIAQNAGNVVGPLVRHTSCCQVAKEDRLTRLVVPSERVPGISNKPDRDDGSIERSRNHGSPSRDLSAIPQQADREAQGGERQGGQRGGSFDGG